MKGCDVVKNVVKSVGHSGKAYVANDMLLNESFKVKFLHLQGESEMLPKFSFQFFNI